jgi:hypothetical protein
LRHQLPLALLSAGSTGLLYATRDYADVITRPWRVLKGRAPVISQDPRRGIGMWAGSLQWAGFRRRALARP